MKYGILGVLFVTMVFAFSSSAEARSNYFTTYCSSCHSSVTATCDGCHAHGTHSTSSKNDINVKGVTNKTSYAPGETVSVTITGGYGRGGWVRALLYNAAGTEVARSTGPGGTGGGAGYPVTLSAPAPSTSGSYSWKVAWYGNKFDLTDAGAGTTHFGAGWTPDPGNANHGAEIVSTNAFSVTAAASPSISLAPTSLDFGALTTGSSATKTSLIQNTGSAGLDVTAIALGTGTSTEYTWSPSAPFTVAAGGSTTLSLTYSPVDITIDSGDLQISSNDTANPTVTLTVTGSGVAPQAQVIDIDISTFTVSARNSLAKVAPIVPQLTVTNPGTLSSGTGLVTATLVGVENNVQIYSQTIALDNIAIGATAGFSFPAYTPTALGIITWTVTVTDQDPDIDQTTATTKVVK